jgi:hypothetical protein
MPDEIASVRLTPADLRNLDILARAKGANRSDLMRSALREGVRSLADAPDITPGALLRAKLLPQMVQDRAWPDEMTTLVRVADELLSSNAGLVPSNIAGQLISYADRARNLVRISNKLPMPARGKTFRRPRATTRTAPPSGVAESSELPSRALVASEDDITKNRRGSTLELSEQDADWVEAEGLDAILRDMATAYGEQTEADTAVAVEAACTTGNGNVLHTSLTASMDVLTAAAAQAFGIVYAATKTQPDAFLVAPDRLVYLLGLTDADHRPFFTLDAGPLGLPFVSSPSLQHGFQAVLSSQYLETYSNEKGLLQYSAQGATWGDLGNALQNQSVPVPSTLGFVVAYRGDFAALCQPAAVCSLEDLNVGGGSWSS